METPATALSNQKLKILQVGLSKRYGGIENTLLHIYEKIDRSQMDFEFISYFSSSTSVHSFLKLNSVIHTMPQKKNPVSLLLFFSRLLREHQYDAVTFHKNSAANLLPIIIVRILGFKKIYVYAHNTQPTFSNLFTRLLHFANRPLLCSLASRRIAISSLAGNFLFGTRAVDSGTVQIIPPPIDYERFAFNNEIRHEVRRELGIADKETVIGHVGRFSKAKNQSFLLDVFFHYSQTNPNSRLLLVGEGDLKLDMEEKAELLQIRNRVIFTGKREDVNRMYQAMDLFVMPSIYEGLPATALEAQASGLPCVLSDTISREAKINGAEVHFIPLESSGDRWAEKLSDILRCYHERCIKPDEKWDITSIAKSWQVMYERE